LRGLRGKIAGFQIRQQARKTPSGEPNLRKTRADKREARPGVSASASQEREASSSIAGEPTRRITYLSTYK
jgi:hypothetical protein